ncbi:MAG TPA: NosD domain-containing protein [Pyrinomonadaceae bacterium]|nr:NosD domain-containing protein [Pyrinomonadaceae bacterium]
MNQKSLRFLSMMALLVGIIALGSGRAHAARLNDDDHDGDGGGHHAQFFVDDDHAQCPTAQFTSIQAAVTAASPGDTINVCPGTYHEQVTINKSLTVQGISVKNQNQAIVMPAAVSSNTTSLTSGNPIAPIILVDRTSKVNLINLTVDGSTGGLTGCAAPNYIGVYYRNASGRIEGLAVRNIKLGAGSEGCQNGLGIFVQSGQGGSSKVDILSTSVHDYQKNGITANEAGTEVNIKGNAVTGVGSTPFIAQNGIQLGFGAKGTIDGNTVINHVYAPCTPSNPAGCNNGSSTNILIFNSDNVKVTKNTTGNSQTNIYYQGNRGEVSGNTVAQSTVFDGIDLIGNRNNANGNTIFNSQMDGIYVQGNQNNANGNLINEAAVGVFEDSPSSGNNFNGNKFYNTGLNVVPATSSTSPLGTNSLVGSGASGRAIQPAQP